MKKITSIEKGSGEGSTFFSIDTKVQEFYRVDEIKKEPLNIGRGYYNDLIIDVYNCYRDGKLIATIESNSSLTISYE